MAMQDCAKTAVLVIGFTATPFCRQDNFESKYLNKLGFKMFNSLYKTELPEDLESTTLADFLAQFELDLFAKIVKESYTVMSRQLKR